MIDGPRGLMPEELDDLIKLIHKVYNPKMRRSFPTLFCEENADNLRVIKTDGKFVSHIGIVIRDMVINGCRISVGNIGSVCTDEDYRERGYAWKIFEDAMDKYRAKGVDIFLVSGFRSLYRLHGCAHVGTVAKYTVNCKADFPKTTARARLFRSKDLPEWALINVKEPVRFHRPYDDFQKLTGRIPLSDGRQLYSIIERNKIVAYVSAIKATEEIVYFMEYAGSRQALLGCVPALCEDFDAQKASIPVPIHDKQFSLMLRGIGVKASYSNTGGTITILHFPRLCQKLSPLFEEIIGAKIAQKLKFEEQDGLYRISLDNDEMVMNNPHDVARLIFGNPTGRDERTEITADGELREVLRAIFPIPRPEYGLSYI